MGLIGWLSLLGVGVCAAASFFFALAESSLFALGKARARRQAAQPGGALVVQLLEQPAELLATIALGNTLANGGLVALALWPALHGQWPLGPTLLVVLALTLIGCEVLPKTLAVRTPEKWAVRVAGPMVFLRSISGGFQRLVQRFNEWVVRSFFARGPAPAAGLTDEEYKELLDLAYQQGAIKQQEKELILQIISLDRKAARDVMRPRSRMTAISDDLSIEQMIEAARQHGHRRLPLYDETPDTIVGILDTQKLLLNPTGDLSEAVDFPSFVPETMNCLKLLQSLQRQQRGLAIVLDEYGGVAGVVRVEDILEEVVGSIRDEGQPLGVVIEKLEPGRWRVNGLTWIEDFRREYSDLPPVSGVDTMGGLMVRLLEVVPAPGQSAVFGGLRLTATAADERRVKELIVETVKRK